jgi:hypothetical protein
MELLVRENVFLTVSDAWMDRASVIVSLKGRELTVTFSDPAKRDAFIDRRMDRIPHVRQLCHSQKDQPPGP